MGNSLCLCRALSIYEFKSDRLLGIDSFEFSIRLVAESSEQAQAWRLEQQRKEADAIGMSWQEFKQLNGIEE